MGEVKRWDFLDWGSLAEDLDGDYVLHSDYAALEAERDALADEKADCEKFLKEGERLDECLERWRADASAVLDLLIQEKKKSEALEAERDALRAEVAALKAACAAKDGALGICQDMLTFVNESSKQYKSSVVVALRTVAAALSTDAGKGWIDATGAVEAVAEACEWSNDPIRSRPTKARVMQGVPDDWAGSRVLIVRVAK